MKKRKRFNNKAFALSAIIFGSLLVGGGFAANAAYSSVEAEAANNNSSVATYLDEATCASLGRKYIKQGSLVGCSRTQCVREGAKKTGDFNTESCQYKGTEYAVSLESRLCGRLNRVWLGAVNRCLQNVDRTATSSNIIADAIQCTAPYTSYIPIPASAGQDICITPADAQKFQKMASSKRQTVAEVVLHNSEVLCAGRSQYNWSGKFCNPLGPREKKKKNTSPVFVIGDSVTWRAADELTTLNPTWEVDGQPGSALSSFAQRLDTYLAVHNMPSTVVIGLGANNGVSTTSKATYEQAISLLPKSTKVVLVTPYRDPKLYAKKAELMNNTESWMKDIARTRPGTCVAPWKQRVTANPSLVVDGVHQQQNTELYWAQLVSNTVKTCK